MRGFSRGSESTTLFIEEKHLKVLVSPGQVHIQFQTNCMPAGPEDEHTPEYECYEHDGVEPVMPIKDDDI